MTRTRYPQTGADRSAPTWDARCRTPPPPSLRPTPEGGTPWASGWHYERMGTSNTMWCTTTAIGATQVNGQVQRRTTARVSMSSARRRFASSNRSSDRRNGTRSQASSGTESMRATRPSVKPWIVVLRTTCETSAASKKTPAVCQPSSGRPPVQAMAIAFRGLVQVHPPLILPIVVRQGSRLQSGRVHNPAKVSPSRRLDFDSALLLRDQEWAPRIRHWLDVFLEVSAGPYNRGVEPAEIPEGDVGSSEGEDDRSDGGAVLMSRGGSRES